MDDNVESARSALASMHAGGPVDTPPTVLVPEGIEPDEAKALLHYLALKKAENFFLSQHPDVISAVEFLTFHAPFPRRS